MCDEFFNELIALEKYTRVSSEKSRIRHLLSFYLAGARISDVLRIKWCDLNDGRLYYKMEENNKVGSVKITSKAERIINLYKARKNKLDAIVLPELNKADITDNKEIYRKITSA